MQDDVEADEDADDFLEDEVKDDKFVDDDVEKDDDDDDDDDVVRFVKVHEILQYRIKRLCKFKKKSCSGVASGIPEHAHETILQHVARRTRSEGFQLSIT